MVASRFELGNRTMFELLEQSACVEREGSNGRHKTGNEHKDRDEYWHMHFMTGDDVQVARLRLMLFQ